MSGFILRFVTSIPLFVMVLAEPAVSGEEWSFLPPAPLGVRSDAFSAVDGAAADDIWAVGAWQPPDWNQRCLIEHFDGVSWTKPPLPEIGSGETLLGVVAVARDRALAVGTYRPVGTTVQPLALEWNGTEWVSISPPGFAGGRSFEAIDETPSGEIWSRGFSQALLGRRSSRGGPMGIGASRWPLRSAASATAFTTSMRSPMARSGS